METKKRKTFYIAISVVITVLLLCLLGYIFIPFYYNGAFSISEYEYADLKEIISDRDFSNTKNIGKIKNAFDAYKKTDNFLKEEKIETVEKGLLYTVQLDRENNIWKVHAQYKYAVFGSFLYEGLSVFITADGYVLAVVHGG